MSRFGQMDWSSSILPLSSPKSSLIRKGLLQRAILRNFNLQLNDSTKTFHFFRLVERAIRHERKTCVELMTLFSMHGASPLETLRFMRWLEQWLMRIVYRDGNPISRDRVAMGQALAIYLYRCADAHDYEVAEQLVLRRADPEQRWEGGTALMHVAADVHNGIEESKGPGSRVRMLELLLFHGANVHSRLDSRYQQFNNMFFIYFMHSSAPAKRHSCWPRKKTAMMF